MNKRRITLCKISKKGGQSRKSMVYYTWIRAQRRRAPHDKEIWLVVRRRPGSPWKICGGAPLAVWGRFAPLAVRMRGNIAGGGL